MKNAHTDRLGKREIASMRVRVAERMVRYASEVRLKAGRGGMPGMNILRSLDRASEHEPH